MPAGHGRTEDVPAGIGRMEKEEFSLTVEPRGSCLYAAARGVRTGKTVSAIAFRIADAAAAHGFSRILVDVRRLEGRLGAVDGLAVVTDVFRKLRGTGLRQAAILDIPQTALPNNLLETMARNRGFNLRIFSNESAALMWLEMPPSRNE
jgi:hypothetical protein